MRVEECVGKKNVVLELEGEGRRRRCSFALVNEEDMDDEEEAAT